jgi:hypothetical protein
MVRKITNGGDPRYECEVCGIRGNDERGIFNHEALPVTGGEYHGAVGVMDDKVYIFAKTGDYDPIHSTSYATMEVGMMVSKLERTGVIEGKNIEFGLSIGGIIPVSPSELSELVECMREDFVKHFRREFGVKSFKVLPLQE